MEEEEEEEEGFSEIRYSYPTISGGDIRRTALGSDDSDVHD